MKNVFYFISKALFILEIFKFLYFGMRYDQNCGSLRKQFTHLVNRQYEKSEKKPTTKTVKRNWEIKNIKKLRGFIGNTKQFLSYLTSLIIIHTRTLLKFYNARKMGWELF